MMMIFVPVSAAVGEVILKITLELSWQLRWFCLNHPDPTVASHRLGWHRLGYGEMTEELRVPCDHLEKLHCCAHQY